MYKQLKKPVHNIYLCKMLNTGKFSDGLRFLSEWKKAFDQTEVLGTNIGISS